MVSTSSPFIAVTEVCDVAGETSMSLTSVKVDSGSATSTYESACMKYPSIIAHTAPSYRTSTPFCKS